MSTKPYIHPEILLQIRNSNSNEVIDKIDYSSAKAIGEEAANILLSQLFPKNQQFGKIESHFNTERLNSKQHQSIRDRIVSMHFQRNTLEVELNKIDKSYSEISGKVNKLRKSFFKFLYKKKLAALEDLLHSTGEERSLLEQTNNESFIDLKFEFDKNIKECYSDFVSAFSTMSNSAKIWDVTMSQINLETKAAAGTSITRNEVKFDLKSLDILKTQERVLHLQNHNGGDLYFYPNFIVYYKNKDEIAIIEYSELFIAYEDSSFLEEERSIPSDTTRIGETWYRVNKDGSPDRRFTGNYKIPVVRYGAVKIKTLGGINEMYHISDFNKAKHFAEQYKVFQNAMKNTMVHY